MWIQLSFSFLFSYFCIYRMAVLRYNFTNYYNTGKCMIPCLNGGRCRGVNTCRCPDNYSGDHCEIGLTKTSSQISKRQRQQEEDCSIPCRNGNCIIGSNKCQCFQGWFGRRCRRSEFVILWCFHYKWWNTIFNISIRIITCFSNFDKYFD